MTMPRRNVNTGTAQPEPASDKWIDHIRSVVEAERRKQRAND